MFSKKHIAIYTFAIDRNKVTVMRNKVAMYN